MVEIREELLDELIKDYKNPEDLLGKNGLLGQLKKRLIEKAMQSEMNDHLGYSKSETIQKPGSNRRNGYSKENRFKHQFVSFSSPNIPAYAIRISSIIPFKTGVILEWEASFFITTSFKSPLTGIR